MRAKLRPLERFPRPVRRRKSLPCVRGGVTSPQTGDGRVVTGSLFDRIFSSEDSTGYNPPRRRGLRIAPNPASGISRSLRRSSSPKHNHCVGLCLGPRLADSPLYTRGPLTRPVSDPIPSHKKALWKFFHSAFHIPFRYSVPERAGPPPPRSGRTPGDPGPQRRRGCGASGR